MTTTMDIPVNFDGGGRSDGNEAEGPDSPGGARARVRARGAIVTQPARAVAKDVSGAWVWREAPPALRDLIASRTDTSRALSDTPLVRAGWLVWNTVVAIPTTATLYVLAWVFQHPARAGVAALVVVPLTLMWIK